LGECAQWRSTEVIMNRKIWAVIGVSLAMSQVLGTPAKAAPDKTATVAAGAEFKWTGTTATGMNQYYWDPAGVGPAGPVEDHKCDKTQAYYCEDILLKFENPFTAAELADPKKKFKDRSATILLDAFSPASPVSDFDLFAYESDASGAVGQELDSDGAIAVGDDTEEVNVTITTTKTVSTVYVLARVVYFQVVNGNYKGTVSF
jgi:hypothetical protein